MHEKCGWLRVLGAQGFMVRGCCFDPHPCHMSNVSAEGRDGWPCGDWSILPPPPPPSSLLPFSPFVTAGRAQVAKWLDATLYTTDFRPVTLRERVKVGNVVYTAEGALVRDLGPPATKADPDQLARLCAETVVEGGRVRRSGAPLCPPSSTLCVCVRVCVCVCVVLGGRGSMVGC